MQGATHDTARYHPTDVSSFEEGYVAITRARVGARIYVVDGNLPAPDDELSHTPDEPRPFDMSEVAAALGRRRGGHMAADAASDLSAVAATLDRSTLSQLTQRRRQLGRILDGAPPAVDHVIDDAERTLDALRARRNAWHDATDNHAEDAAGPTARTPRANSAITHLDRAIASQERKLAAANRQQTERNQWLAEHADVVAEHALVVRAERARETQVRIAAIHQVPEALVRLIGPEPWLQRDRHTWRRAIETTALYRERHDATVVASHGIRAVLGERPAGSLARAEYAAATRTIEDAQVAAPSVDVGVGSEL